MRVSFDLDDTIFVSPQKFRTENELKFPLNKLFKERLRFGTIKLFNYLYENNIEIWIYTTSFRSERYIRNLFRCYGLKVNEIINGERHEKKVQRSLSEIMPSKYPAKYRIDLHIDDDVSVMKNGIQYGFNVFIISNQDDKWVEMIIEKITSIKKLKNQEK